MNFTIFLSEYKSRIYKGILPSEFSYKEIPKYRLKIFIFYLLFLIIGLSILWFLNKDIFLKYYFLIVSISFIPYMITMSYFTSKEKNRIEWNNFRKNSYNKNIRVLTELLEEYKIDTKEKRDYIINSAKKCKDKYLLRELFKLPTIFCTILSLFVIPRFQKIINQIPDTLFFMIFLLFLLFFSILYLLYNVIKIFYISNYEVCEKLINDLEYLNSFKEDFLKEER